MTRPEISTRNITRQGTGLVPRRKVLKGAAWSVPVIAAAAASPARAASTNQCADPPVEVRADSLAWNDGAGGTHAIGIHNGRPVFGPSQSLFADLRLTNEGTTTITGFQTTFSLTKGSYTPGSVKAYWVRSDGTSVPANLPEPVYTDPSAPHLDQFAFSYFAVPTPPGVTQTFRLTWKAAASTGGQYIDSGLYGIGQARSVNCNGVDVLRTILNEKNRANNDAYVRNPFYVRAP